MTENSSSHRLSRRTFLAGGAGVVGGSLVGARLLTGSPAHAAPAAPAAVQHPVKRMHLVGTDGWVSMPDNAPPDPPFFPDPLAPSPFNTYVFGFRDVTNLTATQVAAQRGKAQISAPMLSFDEEDDIYMTLTNLGLLQRPDLFDGHTLHWHGFVNAIPLVRRRARAFPGGAGRARLHLFLPAARRGHVHVPLPLRGRRARADGHDRHGLRPARSRTTTPVNCDPAGTKYAYNDGDGSTGYDREFAFMITELWSAAHYRDAHIQVNDWTDFDPSFWLLNGAPTRTPSRRTAIRCSTAAGRLQYQPISSLVTCNTGERVLLRLSNLGYQNHAMTVDNIDLQIVAKDASLLKGRDGTTNYITTNTVDIGPGREPRRHLRGAEAGRVPALRPQVLLPRTTVAAPGTAA